MDPMRLWQQWYTTSLRAFSEATNSGPGPREAFADPWGIAAQWFAMAGAPGATKPKSSPSAPPNPMNPAEVWQWWLNAMTQALPGAMPGADPFGLLARWRETLGAAFDPTHAAAGSAASPLPTDAWEAFRQWYDASSGTWAKAVDELVGSPAFAEAAGRFMEGYTSYARALRQTCEAYFSALQLPTRADIARVAGLVVSLEEKVDNIEQAQEESADSAMANTRALATAASVTALDARLSRLENKLDRLLAATERSAGQDVHREEHMPPPAPSANNGATARAHKPRTTTRSRRQSAASPRIPPAP
jgi:polyhydroxyalkanoic acid synthase PhaR subunit